MLNPIRSSNSILFLLYISSASASTTIDCANSSLALDKDLVRIECKEIESIIIENYELKDFPSLYATDFDKRIIVIAHGKNMINLKKIYGIHKNSLQQNNLITPPFPDQIEKIAPLKNYKHKNWTISTEIITYSNQNREGPGYAIKCATALRSTSKNSTILAECFPFEESDRFIQTLELVQ